MPEFRYTARDAQGQLVEGVVAANHCGAGIGIEQKRPPV
jgi:type II secretory pathway component PulF